MSRKWIPVMALLLLIAVSAASVFLKLPVSSDLDTNKQEDAEGRVIRIDYVDTDGNITNAADMGYATRIRTFEGSDMVREEYFDSRGKMTRCASGYSVLCRSYYADGHADTDTYYDKNGEQVESISGVYGYKRIYDAEGRLAESCYIDKNGQLMENDNGVADFRREFYEDGHVKREFYYDRDGKPAVSHAGQHGEYREYDENGRLSCVTFLNENGTPVKSKYGYSTVRRTYDADGNLYEQLYYDEHGSPASGRNMQYGERYVDGQTVFLDSSGQPMKRLDNYLNTHPVIVVVLGICLIAAALCTKGPAKTALLFGYVLFILFMTMWFRETGDARSRLDLFWSYRRFLTDPSMRQSIINNIWLFVPLGVLIYKKDTRRFLIPVVLSIIIEAVQYFTGIGLCELDDVFSNSLGGLIGYGLAMLSDN